MDKNKSKIDNIDEDVNFYYNTFYSSYGNNLEHLKSKIDEDFFKQEEHLAELLKSLEDQKENYLHQLDSIDKEYSKLLDVNKTVFKQIDECNKTIEGYQRNESHFRTYLQNLSALETEIDKMLS